MKGKIVSKLLCMVAIVIVSTIGVVTGMPSLLDTEIPELPNATEIDVVKVIQLLHNRYAKILPEAVNERVILKAYETYESPQDVFNFYNDSLHSKNYHFFKEGTLYLNDEGYLFYDNPPRSSCVRYYAWMNGVTASGLITVAIDGECMFVYTQGFILEYTSLYNWLTNV